MSLLPLSGKTGSVSNGGSAHLLLVIAACCTCAAGCSRQERRARGRMTLVSNQENTVFELKGVDDADWRTVGKGKIIPVALEPKQAYEVAAKPDGYCRKTVTLTEPLRELRFTFEIGDREDRQADVILELDVRVSSVLTSQVVASAHERINGLLDMRRAVEACTSRLIAKGALDAKVAIVPFEEIGTADVSEYGRSASSMMTSALAENKATAVMERAQLKRLLDERDLTWAAIATNPGKLGPVEGVQNLVVGTLSRVK